MNYRTRKIMSVLLGLISAGGTIATAILVAKETPKAMKKIEELKQKENVRKRDYIKALIPIYWPAGIICLGTIASSTISNVMSTRAEASLIATSTMLNQGWNRYKGKVKDILGIEQEKKISNEVSAEQYYNQNANKIRVDNGQKLYYEEHLGWFVCRECDLLTAITDLNQRLHTPDPSPNGTFYFTTLYFLIKDANAKVLNKSRLNASKNIGWTTDYLCEVYDISCMWVHVYFTKAIKKETGELLYTKIDFWEDPITLEESEISRDHYKSRADYEHEAECDMHDAAAFDLYYHGYQDVPKEELERSMLNSKIDCDRINDSGRRFQSSDIKSTSAIVFVEEDSTLPQADVVPTMEDFKNG